MGFKVRQEIFASELVPGDLTVDKTGTTWTVGQVNADADLVTFEIVGIAHVGKRHWIKKASGATVTVLRETLADHPFEAFDGASGLACTKLVTGLDGTGRDCGRPPTEHPSPAEQALVQTFPNAEKITEITTEQQAQADQASAEQPVELPAFESLTDLEQRSHVYLLHGVYSTDIVERAKLAKMHADLHAGKKQVQSRLVPHVHADV